MRSASPQPGQHVAGQRRRAHRPRPAGQGRRHRAGRPSQSTVTTSCDIAAFPNPGTIRKDSVRNLLKGRSPREGVPKLATGGVISHPTGVTLVRTEGRSESRHDPTNYADEAGSSSTKIAGPGKGSAPRIGGLTTYRLRIRESRSSRNANADAHWVNSVLHDL